SAFASTRDGPSRRETAQGARWFRADVADPVVADSHDAAFKFARKVAFIRRLVRPTGQQRRRGAWSVRAPPVGPRGFRATRATAHWRHLYSRPREAQPCGDTAAVH